MVRNVEFNGVPVGSIINCDGEVFVKVKDAIPSVSHSKQPSNCISLSYGRRVAIEAKHPVDIFAYPTEIDDLGAEIFQRVESGKTWNPIESGEYIVTTRGLHGDEKVEFVKIEKTK